MPDRAAERLIADRYALEVPIGQGGMGIVWRARDTLLGREVAIKEVRLPPTVPDADRDALRARVLREARTAARLNHPGAVTLYDVINEQGHAYIVMELIDGPTLAQVVAKEGPLDPLRAAHVGLQVAGTLAAAHEARIVHRDVKPANVMLAGDGTVRLTDFGIARVQGDPKLTSTGLIVGSPAYMAPEQASGAAAGPPADLWSLGAMLYFAVEGRPPFERGSSIATLTALVNDDPPPPRRAGALGPVIAALLSKPPEDRPTATELFERLERVIAAEPEPTLPGRPVIDLAAENAGATERQEAPAAGRRGPARGRLPRGRLGVVVALLAVVALGAVTLGLSGAFSRDEDRGGRAAPAISGVGATTGRATTTTASQAPTTGAGPVTTAPAKVPAGWTSFRREAGAYSLAYPRGWQVSTSSLNNDTDLRGPGGLLLRVQSSDHPRDPMQAWTELERDFASRHAQQGYRRLALGRGSYAGLDAAVWEFSYVQSGQRIRARDVTFKSPSGRWGYAVLLRAPERRWAEAQTLAPGFERAFTALG
ncbi:MAG TPA: serine/threonine-protein kinase [Actinomycetota bacterium]|jgi:tRNA A-37 threonylcarbamoyl transferase component Bud32|nr:serine/threonine-protein kinase [Actinomycetota bacterium]